MKASRKLPTSFFQFLSKKPTFASRSEKKKSKESEIFDVFLPYSLSITTAANRKEGSKMLAEWLQLILRFLMGMYVPMKKG